MRSKISAKKLEAIMRYFFIFITIVAIVFILMERDADGGDWEQITGAFITLILFILPSIFYKRLKITLNPIFQIIILLFIFASLYLGEVRDFFYRYSWWDSMLHFSSAMIITYIGFLLIFTLNKDKEIHLKLSPFFIALFTFCFASMIGVIWEIFEFLADHFTGINMQKARNLEVVYGVMDTRLGVIDTMKDLIVNSAGALIVSIYGYIYSRYKMKSSIEILKDKFIEDNPQLFE